MRKTLIQTLLVAFCAILAHAPLEGGGVMLIGMRNAMLSGGKRMPTAKDYVQDGLIAMWDGIENAGWGVHDASATTWKDLTGIWGDATLSTRASWSDNALVGLTGSGYLARGTGNSKTSDDMVTAEVVFKSVSTNQQRLFCPRTIYDNKMLQYLQEAGNSKQRILSPNAKYNWYNYTPTLGKVTNTRISAALIYDDISPSEAKYTFLNGELLTGSHRSGCQAGSVSGYFDIGGRADAQGWTTFLGEINCLRIYSRALTADEVAANYKIDKERFNLP